MSGARRAYDLIRAYVSHGWEHLTESEEGEAQQELRQAIESPTARASGPGYLSQEEPVSLKQARKLFDLTHSATERQIIQAYDALRSSTDPAKFTNGSDAWQRAILLRRRLDSARSVLLENMDPTVRRFEKLEIE